MIFSTAIRLLTLTILFSSLHGCATLSGWTHFNDLASHAESVFRHQNELISRLMMLSDAELLEDDQRIESGEQAMHDACHLLNEYAERESAGESISLMFRQKVQASIDGCDVSIKHLEALLSAASVKQ